MAKAKKKKAPPDSATPHGSTYPRTVVELAQAAKAGTDCFFALHDALAESGHDGLALHFHDGKPCHAGKRCPLLEQLRTQGEFARPVDQTDRWGHRQRLGEALKVCLDLHLAGVAEVLAEFSGMEDSGTVEAVRFFGPNGKEISRKALADPKAQDAIEDLCCEALPGGWEINEGAGGTYRLDPAGCTAAVEYTPNYYTDGGEGREPGESESWTIDYRKAVGKRTK